MDHEVFMDRCFHLASLGLGEVSPNPMVGSVIVKDGRVIGEGFHRKCGEAHAEVNAIESVENNEDLWSSTLYVNLEPCCHEGRTPPCAHRIVEEGIPRVVFGMYDPSEKVKGKGVQYLKENGVEVHGPVLEGRAQHLNRRFITYHKHRRPYMILKWACTLDGFIDRKRNPGEKGINWITGEAAKRVVHSWRAQEDAILVGTRTAMNDDPSLTAREMPGEDPLRVLVDRKGKVPHHSKLFTDPAHTLVFTETDPEHFPSHVSTIRVDEEEALLPRILEELYRRDVSSLIVEGGSKILNSFIRSDLWDEARVFIGDRTFGDGKRGPRLDIEHIKQEDIGNDRLLVYENRRG